MNSTILAFLLFMSFFVATLWPDKHHFMRFFNILGKFFNWLAGKIRFEILIFRANRNLRRRNRKQH